MNNKQQNKLIMYRTVSTHLAANAAITATIPALAKAGTDLAAGIAEIDALATRQAQPVQVATIDKESALEALADAAIGTAGALRAYAAAQDNRELLEKVKVSPSRFRNLRAAERITHAQLVHDEAAKLIDSLGEHGVTAGDLAALKSSITLASANVAAPRTAVGQKRTATVGLQAVYDRLDALLDRQIDPLALKLKAKEPGFYAGYRSARVIVDRSISGAAAKGTTTLKTPAATAPGATAASTPATAAAGS